MAPPVLEWHQTDDGWRFGNYAVVHRGPGRWALTVGGTARSEYSRASDAAAAAQEIDRRRRRRSKLLRNGVMVAVAALLWTAALAWRFVPNGEFPPALESALALEDAYRAVVDGSVSVDSFTAAIEGGSFVAGPAISLGGEVEERGYAALVTKSGADCYVVRWSPDPGVRLYDIHTGVLSADQPCEVTAKLLQEHLFEKSWFQPVDGSAFDWGHVLPPEELQASWFIPVLIALALVMLNGMIGITLAIVSPPPGRVPALRIGVVRR